MTDYTIEFTAPELLPMSENEMRRGRTPGARMGYHKRLERWKYAAHNAWKNQRYGPAGGALGQHCEVMVELGFHYHRRRDPHNYVGTVIKSIIDGFVAAGLWPDDNPEWVMVHEPVLVIHNKVPNSVPLPCKVTLRTKEVG